ncbi:MAG: hypothetical protein LBR93_05430, partial [Treponema sp.]|nr:hypothetical protein [Treponema sp.]
MGEAGKDEKAFRQNPAGGEEPVPALSRRGIKSYVLRAGRMSPAQKRSYGELSPRFSVPFDSSGRVLDYRALFGNSNPVTVEIGFGMGIATAEIAQANPGQNYLGLEVYR